MAPTKKTAQKDKSSRPKANREKPVKSAASKPAEGAEGWSGNAGEEQGAGLNYKVRDLINGVAETTGAKKKDVKPMVEAVLSELGDALSRGGRIMLPGLGLIRIAKTVEKDGDTHMVLKFKRVLAKKSDQAEDADLVNGSDAG